MKAPPCDRRRFLAGLVGLGVVSLRPPGARAGPRTEPAAGSTAPALAEVLRHRASAVAVGEAYLRVARHEREPRCLVRLIEVRCGELVFEARGEALRRCLARRIRQDFAEGQVVEVQGWVLSATEARLCALAALLLATGRHGGRR
jgi:hypothetical protein